MRQRIPLAVSCLLAAVMLNTATTIPDSKDVYGSLAFVFDTTSSMWNDLPQCIPLAKQIITHVRNQSNLGIKHFVFVPFKDPNVGSVTDTFDPNKIIEELNHIKVDGGGDCREMSISATIQALKVVQPKSYIYVFTDASAKDSHLINETVELIQRKKSQVIVFKTGKCNNSSGNGYERLASLGGVIVVKSCEEAVFNFIKESIGMKQVNLLFSNVPPIQIERPFSRIVDIDESIESFSITVSGVNSTIELENPNQTSIDMKIELDSNDQKIRTISDPVCGMWKLFVTCESNHRIHVFGKSSNDFNFGFAAAKPENMTQTGHRPIIGKNNYILIEFPNVKEFNACLIQDLDDSKTKSLQIFPSGENMLLCGPFLPDDKPFYVQIKGTTKHGKPFKRITQTSITPYESEMPTSTMNKTITAILGEKLTVLCDVESPIPFNVTWTINGLNKPPLYYNKSFPVEFIVNNVNQTHAGNYTCTVRNVAGYSESKTKVTVIATCPPMESKNVDIKCYNDGEENKENNCSKKSLPGTKLIRRCKEPLYKLPNGTGELNCRDDGTWSDRLEDCVPVTCPPINSTTFDVKFTNKDGKENDCSNDCLPGTTLIPVCMDRNGSKIELVCHDDGNWSKKLFSCKSEGRYSCICEFK